MFKFLKAMSCSVTLMGMLGPSMLPSPKLPSPDENFKNPGPLGEIEIFSSESPDSKDNTFFFSFILTFLKSFSGQKNNYEIKKDISHRRFVSIFF